MTTTQPDIRWKQRFQNLTKARQILLEAHKAHTNEPNNKLYQMALIQSFEFTYELSWKTVKDYLHFNGVSVSLPREVIKEGFSFGIIKNGDTWIKMLEDRNLMAHAYDESAAKEASLRICNIYITEINTLFDYLESKH